MSDVIKRSDAIKAVNKAKAEGMVECPTYYIGLIPSADRPQGWIPCSERLPEKDGDYLVTLHHKWLDQEYKTVEIKKFKNGGFDENKYIKVVAWTPKPAPWEGADDEVLRQL